MATAFETLPRTIQPGTRVAVLPAWGMTVTVNGNEVGTCRPTSHVPGIVEHVGAGWLILRIGNTTLARVLTEGVTANTDTVTAEVRLTIQNVRPRWRAEGFVNDRLVLGGSFTDRQAALDTLNAWGAANRTDDREPYGWVVDELTREILW